MTDPDLPPLDGVDVAVIGAGLAGLSAARKLARAGAVVTVTDSGPVVIGKMPVRMVPMPV